MGSSHDEAALAAVARHALHDEELIAGFAAGGIEPGADTDRAQALVERCSVCRDLHHDLVEIGTALRAAATSTTPAPRDFRLTVEDARRLGGAPSARGFLAGLRGAITTFGRPVGATLATFGVVGLLVGSVSLGGSAAGLMAADAGASAAPGSESQAGELTGPTQSTDRTGAYGPAASPKDAIEPDMPRDRDLSVTGASPTAWLLAGSGAILAAGLALLMLASRGAGRRPHRHQDR